MDQDQRDTAARTVGRYEILRQIGQGGMATVYLARQPGLDREVALKELDRFGIADQVLFTSRFVREAKLAGSLNHPNIVTVLDYFEHDGRPYIAMEHLEGGSLREYLGDLSLAQVMGVLEGLLAGLTHAEDRGIAHRDIKPENILVTAEGRIKLTDFGIARAYNAALSVLTVAGTTVGTPKYMAPEQGTGKQLSARTDLYAVGIVAYEMLVGRVPFDSEENALAIVWQHVNDPLPDPRVARPDLDPRVCRWLEELLEKDPADRPPSARAALDALEEIVVDLLGAHWRRDARLAAPKVADRSARPLTPARIDEVVDARNVPTGISLDDAPEPLGANETTAPRTPHDATAAFRDALDARQAQAGQAAQPPPAAATPRARRKAGPVPATAGTAASEPASRSRSKPPRASAPPQRRRLAALIGGLLIVMALAGYAISRDDGAPRHAPAPTHATVSKNAAAIRDEADRQRYIVAMRAVFKRFGRERTATLTRLRHAKGGAAQATTARRVGHTYTVAAADLAKLTPAAAQQQPARLVRAELRRVASRYQRLAAAAKAHGVKRYAAAGKAIAAFDAALNKLVARMPF
jgi:tRNA A-37 threonylcarbamoyl transferase component Bud32